MRRFAPLVLSLLTLPPQAAAGTTETFAIRGRPQGLHLYGDPRGAPAVVSSGDGGWVHLGPRIAELLAARGFAVAGFDAKRYLPSFTEGRQTLVPTDVPVDYRALVEHARRGRDVRVLLVGVSEGAGLSVLAASEPTLAPLVEGVLGLGLPEVNELGWRFADSLSYLTKKTPNEPTFRTSDYVGGLADVPLAAIHSAHDEYAPLDEVRQLMALPGGPRRLWVVPAANHAFRGDGGELERSVDEALRWIRGERR